MTAVADDHVVAHFDFQQLAGAYQIARDFNVRLGWRRLATGMIVHEHNGRSGERDRDSEHLARMYEYRIECADGHDMVATNSTACVEQQHRETFTFRVELGGKRNLAAPIVDGSLGGVAELHRFRRRTFA